MFPKGLSDLAHRAASGLRQAATDAQRASTDALRHGRAAAQQAVSANPALALVGSTLAVGGKHVVVDSLLAEGGFAVVYLVSPLGSDGAAGDKLVLKKMFAGGAETCAQLSGEVTLMQQLAHPNIVRVLGADVRRQGREALEILVLMEFCPGGHLLSRLNKQMETGRPLAPPKVVDVFLSIVRPVAYLHALTPPTAHRDLKFENVLIAADGSLRLCDFGSASTFSGVLRDKKERADQEDAITRFTTPHFRAPEMVDLYSNLPLDTRVDVWALGCMLFGLLYFKHPFQESGPLGILSARYRVPLPAAAGGPDAAGVPAPLATALRACLRFDPAERPTAAQLVTYLEAVKAALALPAPGGDAAAAAHAYPPLQLSGGGALPTAGYPPGDVNGAAPLAALLASANVTPPVLVRGGGAAAAPASAATGGFDPGSGGFSAGDAGSRSGGGAPAVELAAAAAHHAPASDAAAARRHAASASAAPALGAPPAPSFHRPTAVEIAAQITAAGPAPTSSALAARMARRGVVSAPHAAGVGVLAGGGGALSAAGAAAAVTAQPQSGQQPLAAAASLGRPRVPSSCASPTPLAASSTAVSAGNAPRPSSSFSHAEAPALDDDELAAVGGARGDGSGGHAHAHSAGSNASSSGSGVAPEFVAFDAFGGAAEESSSGALVGDHHVDATSRRHGHGSSSGGGSSSSSGGQQSPQLASPAGDAAATSSLDDFFSAGPSPAGDGGGVDAFDLLGVGGTLPLAAAPRRPATSAPPSASSRSIDSAPAAAAAAVDVTATAVDDDFFAGAWGAPAAAAAAPAMQASRTSTTAADFADFGF